MSNERKHILLGHLASNGDCLYATTIARQIKNDYQGCYLTWAIGEKYAHVIKNNPFVDETWVIKANEQKDYFTTSWQKFKKEALKRKSEGVYQEVFLTQIYYENFHNYDGLIRSSIFRAYPYPITVPVQPVLRLTEEEVANVKDFVNKSGIQKYQHVILFEASPQSKQSFINLELAVRISEIIIEKNKNTCVIITSSNKITSSSPQIFDGSLLSFRENAELTKYCSLLVGCSSGITWIATSDWAKPLNTIQLLNSKSPLFASVRADHKAFDLSDEHIIEMDKCNYKKVAECIDMTLNQGFSSAKTRFDTIITNSFTTFRGVQFHLFKQFKFKNGDRVHRLHIEKFGFKLKLFVYYFYNLIKFSVFIPFLLIKKLPFITKTR